MPFRRPVSIEPATWLFASLILSFLATEVAALRLSGPRPSVMLWAHPFTAVACAGVLVQYLVAPGVRPARERVILLTVVPFVVFGLGILFPDRLVAFTCSALIVAGALGVAGFTLDGYLGHGWLTAIHELRDALIFPVAAAQAPFWLWRSSLVNPVLDGRVFAVEAVLGVPVTSTVQRTFTALPLAGLIATTVYVCLPIGLMLAIVAQPVGRSFRLLLAVIATGVVGFACYLRCPVVGPKEWYQSAAVLAPLTPDRLLAANVRLGVLRNSMPSLHAAWALLIAFNVPYAARKWRWSLIPFSILTLWATVGLREHWFADICVAAPFAAALQAGIVSKPRVHTLVLAAANAAITIAWLELFRRPGALLMMSTTVMWLFVAGTIVLPLTMALGIWMKLKPARVS